MATFLAGQVLTADDLFVPATESAFNGANQTDISSTAYISGTSECGTTFTASNLGEAEVTVYMRYQAAAGELVFLAAEVFEGASSGGVQVHAPADDDAAAGAENTAGGASKEATIHVTGLTPNTVHYAQAVFKVSGAATSDIFARRIVVRPVH